MKSIFTTVLFFGAALFSIHAFSQTTFTNNDTITTYDNGPGNPFPSTIAVSGLNVYTTKVVVTLHGVNIPNIVCNQVYIQSPTGQVVCLFSRSGPAFYNCVGDFTFDQTSPNQPPTTYGGNFTAGTYHPFIANAQALPANTTDRLDSFNTHNPNGTWNLYENGLIAYNEAGYIASWSLTITSTSVPLSLSLISFDARSQGNTAELVWKTAEEKDTHLFDIERSTDSKIFSRIGSVKAAGNTTEPSEYNYIDMAPAACNNYYRLRMEDRDGTYKYSPVVMAGFASAEAQQLYPNPCHDKLIIHEDQLNNATEIRIVNITGTCVLNQRISQEKGSQIINVSALQPGIYFARIGRQTYRLLKQ